ncbi:unnamed protein product [Symbiodinium necroappetens]|uniref:Uncharacterized protein n=1 Tax=Symbiodinium necroappetens TaxID=1628268 RepID=A0A812WAG9_9DINO|nr:unnamed protein product [Symbiodinium necroappetens]
MKVRPRSTSSSSDPVSLTKQLHHCFGKLCPWISFQVPSCVPSAWAATSLEQFVLDLAARLHCRVPGNMHSVMVPIQSKALWSEGLEQQWP